MKAVIEFELPDEEHLFDGALNGSKWQAAVGDMLTEIRNTLKYGVVGFETLDEVKKAMEDDNPPPEEMLEFVQREVMLNIQRDLYLFLDEHGLESEI